MRKCPSKGLHVKSVKGNARQKKIYVIWKYKKNRRNKKQEDSLSHMFPCVRANTNGYCVYVL